MHIYFIGQKGIPAATIHDSLEARAEALARESLRNGHKVTIATTNLYTSQSPLTLEGLGSVRLPSLNPTIAGGYFYTALSCVAALFIKPDTIHVQGWKAGIMLRMLAPLLPRTIFVWTLSALPEGFEPLQHSFLRWALPFIVSGFHKICTPTRTVQYQLLTNYGLDATYIPDGYIPPSLPEIRPAALGLRKEQYGVLFPKDAVDAKRIAKVYKASKAKKKLVVFTARTSSGLTAINVPLWSRSAQSLIRQAGFIIAADPAYQAALLHAMDAGRVIIATPSPLHQELLGATATYTALEDTATLSKTLHEAAGAPKTRPEASLRAKKHFSWEKSAQEYMRAYRQASPVLVPFDSIISKQGFKIAA